MTDRNVAALGEWLNDVSERTGEDRQIAYHAPRAGLHTVRDRLTVDETAQLPTLVRGTYFEGLDRSRIRRASAAYPRPSAPSPPSFRPTIRRPKAAASGVLHALQRHVNPGELLKVRAQRPAEVKTLLKAA